MPKISGGQHKDRYIKKLENRIHNQRIALRNNWMVIEERAKYRDTPLNSLWFEKVLSLSKENKILKDKIENA